MAYKIAVASSDGIFTDVSFGEADFFQVYEIGDDGQYRLLERREWTEGQDDILSDRNASDCREQGCQSKNNPERNGGLCQGMLGIKKIALVDDCRCVICSKVGFKIRKQLEKKAIAVFDIVVPVNEGLEKIIHYFKKVDNHENLRGIAYL